MLNPYVKVLIEGQSDQGMAKKVVSHSGLSTHKLVVKNGSGNIDRLIPGLAKTGPGNPWIVFRDSDAECPVKLRGRLVQSTPPNPAFLLRIVHPMTEGWLMADPQSFSQYFKVPASKVPADIESLSHAKRALLTLCRKSRNHDIRDDMVRSDGSTGPLYVSRINKFAEEHWDLETAAQNCSSLSRALARLTELRSFLMNQ